MTRYPWEDDKKKSHTDTFYAGLNRRDEAILKHGPARSPFPIGSPYHVQEQSAFNREYHNLNEAFDRAQKRDEEEESREESPLFQNPILPDTFKYRNIFGNVDDEEKDEDDDKPFWKI